MKIQKNYEYIVRLFHKEYGTFVKDVSVGINRKLTKKDLKDYINGYLGGQLNSYSYKIYKLV